MDKSNYGVNALVMGEEENEGMCGWGKMQTNYFED